MITKQVIERLAFGGTVVSERTYPRPFHHHVRSVLLGDLDLSEDDLIELQRRRWIAAPPVAWDSDTVCYPVVGLALVRADAVKYTAHGLGFCALCRSTVALTYNRVSESLRLARHGHTKTTPPCVSYTPAAIVRAAP